MTVDDDQSNDTPFVTFDLGLDVDGEFDVEGDENGHKSRRLIQIPTTNEILAYGGSACTIRKLTTDSEGDSTPSTITVRQWDDEFTKAMAFSFDGKLVLLGNDVGEVNAYRFDEGNLTKTTKADTNDVHPFCRIDSKLGDRFLCASFDSPIRDLQFYPNNKDWIAVATEGGMGLICIKDLSNTASTRYLWDLAAQHHNSGIRSLTFHRHLNDQVFLASLSMDGRLCLWDVSDLDNPQDWKALVRESNKCIPKNDVGDILGADPWDQSCRPIFLTVPSRGTSPTSRVSVLALPGMPYLQLRRLDIQDAKLGLESFDQPNINETEVQGHIEPIVTFASCPNSSYLITGGRDNRVVLWSIQQRADSSLKAKYLRQLVIVESAPTHIVWEKTDKVERVLVACANGKLVIIEGRDSIIPKSVNSRNVVQEQMDSKGTTTESVSKTTETETGIKESNMDDKKSDEGAEGTSHKDTNFDEEDAVPPNPQTKVNKKSKVVFFDDEAMQDDNYSTEDLGLAKKAGLEEEDSLILDRARSDALYDDASDDDDYNERINRRVSSGLHLPEPQAPFGVSATPLDLSRRFLCWNHIGSITLFRGDDELSTPRNSIEISFTDTLSHRNISFTDNLGFIVGSLGEDGAIFATDVADDKENDGEDNEVVRGMSKTIKDAIKKDQRNSKNSKPTGSTLYFNRFETFASIRDKDWVLTLPTGERAVGCSCGEGWVAAMTRYVGRIGYIFQRFSSNRSTFQSPISTLVFFGRKSMSSLLDSRRTHNYSGTQQIRRSILP
jgi:WD40 repeat protein